MSEEFKQPEKSVPNLQEFRPLPQQLEVIKYLRRQADYSKGVHEVLLSGSVGSAKSLTIAHLGVTHCIQYPGANFLIGRLALPDLKETLCKRIQQHLFDTGIDYRFNKQTGHFSLPNRSEITAVSWADANLEKLGSHEFSSGAIEELTETKNKEPYEKLLQRIGRLPHVPETFMIAATNPDSPSHWAYKSLIAAQSERVKVFYSNTYDNPFLPKSYVDGLLERLDEKQAQRMIYGKWIEINSEMIYYAYGSWNRRHGEYEIDKRYPIIMAWDFNIGEGKPLSVALMQYIRDKDEFHIFDEIVVEGQRTLDAMEEAEARGLFSPEYTYIIRGDRSGRNNDTRSVKTDYDIIEKFLSNLTVKNQKIQFRKEVPKANPPIRERHNTVNGYLKNANGRTRMFVWDKAKTADEGFRLTALKKGATYLEDDSKEYQHITTAIGYAVVYEARLLQYSHGPKSGSMGEY